jgi:hypothetical protein
LMIGAFSRASAFLAFAQDASQPHAHPFVHIAQARSGIAPP